MLSFMTDRRRDKIPCTVDGCTKPQNAGGMCAMHYWRVRTHGTKGAPPGRVYPAKATCAVEGCVDVVHAHGWCNLHAGRWYRTGDPLGLVSRKGEPAEVRFWLKVNKTDTCWLWTARINKYGYGQFKAGRHWAAHRWSYTHVVGPIPDGLELDHLCRVRHCVRPDHLEPVTQRENIRRRQPWNPNAAKTHCKFGHEYTAENTYREPSNNSRKCRTCQRERDRKRGWKR